MQNNFGLIILYKDKDIAYLKDKAKDKDIIIGCNNIFTPEDRVTICFN